MLRARNLTATNSSSTKPDPTILVISRVDALSMFDRRATSALAVLPAVSVMVSAAVHLLNQLDVRAGRMRKNLLFLLLDNEALSFMGSQRFLFDLTHGRVAQASDLPLNVESVESVIELAGIGLPLEDDRKLPIYYLLCDPGIAQQTENITSSIWRALNASADDQGSTVRFLNGSLVPPALLPPSLSTQALLKYFVRKGRPLSHIVISDRPATPPFADTFIDSFLDTRWPPSPTANEYLLRLANLLADALHREITEDSSPIPEPISGVKPAELMDCFLKDPGCNLLRMASSPLIDHLEPEVVNFLLSLKGPIPMQTYEPVDGHSWRVSHVVSHLLMGLTGHRLKECPPSTDYGAFTYMYGYYNGSTWCYRSLVETATSFFFLEDGAVAAPGWVRSVPFENQRFVRLFRSAPPSNDKLALALGIILTAITGLIALLVRAFADRLFVRTCDSHLPQSR
uniref:Nicastrin n=1 Tax=Echinococcus granulosus TaxID=6210 RepID=A0A068X1W9_ECHGR|nr:Nicastrin [Echinococcus granulosus]